MASAVRSNTQTPPYTCSWKGCGKKFGRKADMERHHSTIHLRQKLRQCPVPGCRKELMRQDKLNEHMMNWHQRSSRGHVNTRAVKHVDATTFRTSNTGTIPSTTGISSQFSEGSVAVNSDREAPTRLCESGELQKSDAPNLGYWTVSTTLPPMLNTAWFPLAHVDSQNGPNIPPYQAVDEDTGPFENLMKDACGDDNMSSWNNYDADAFP